MLHNILAQSIRTEHKMRVAKLPWNCLEALYKLDAIIGYRTTIQGADLLFSSEHAAKPTNTASLSVVKRAATQCECSVTKQMSSDQFEWIIRKRIAIPINCKHLSVQRWAYLSQNYPMAKPALAACPKDSRKNWQVAPISSTTKFSLHVKLM